MPTRLQIGFDPTDWYFDSIGYDEVAAGLAPGTPVAVNVYSPLEGRLVLNPLAAGSVALTESVEPVGWNPNGAYLARSLGLYVASATGPHKGLPGYVLARGYELPVLEQELTAAMNTKTMLTLTLAEGAGARGVLALSGATLSYAVICKPRPPAH